MSRMPHTQAALKLCDEIFAANMKRHLTLGWLQCFVCGQLTMRSCLQSERGCSLVNKLYRQRQAAATKEQDVR